MNIEFFLNTLFKYKISSEKMEKQFKRLNIKRDTEIFLDNSGIIRVSCVQRQIQLVKTIGQYIGMLNSFMKQAVEEKSQLVIFPEYNFFDLFGLIPGFKFLNSHLNKKAAKGVNRVKTTNSMNSNAFISTVFRGISNPVENGMKKIISYLAKSYGICIYTGSYILKEDGVIYNAGSLFDHDGKCVGTQKKMHLTEFEAHIGIVQDTVMEICTLCGVKAAFPICMDATYFETFQIAEQNGVDIVILPIANMEEYNVWKSLRGIWPRVQESYVYGLKSSLNGWLTGMHFTGKAGIFAPISITQDKDGIVEISPHYEGNYLVTADIDIKKLHDERVKAEYHGDKNPDFEKDYVKKTYCL